MFVAYCCFAYCVVYLLVWMLWLLTFVLILIDNFVLMVFGMVFNLSCCTFWLMPVGCCLCCELVFVVWCSEFVWYDDLLVAALSCGYVECLRGT